SGAADSAHSGIRRAGSGVGAVPYGSRAVERCLPVRVWKAYGQAQSCTPRESEQDLGRVDWRRIDGGRARDVALLGDTIQTLAGWVAQFADRVHGIRRRTGDVGD